MTMTRILAFAMILTLSACGTAKDSVGLNIFKGFKSVVFKKKGAQVNTRAKFTRAFIDAYPRPLIFAEVLSRGVGSPLELQGSNGPVTRYGAPDGTAIAYEGGALIRTHGLSFDLVSADVSDTLQALRYGGGAGLVRIHRYLDGTNKEVTRSYVCEVRAEGRETIDIFQRLYPVTRMIEDCQNVDTRFQNIYWIGAGGVIRKSKSWVSPEIGFILTERL